jgi:hypothetical protein
MIIQKKMLKNSILKIAGTALFLTCNLAFAEPLKIKFNGEPFKQELTPNSPQVEFALPSRGNSSLPFQISLNLPLGATVNVKGVAIERGRRGRKKSFWPIATTNGNRVRESWVAARTATYSSRANSINLFNCASIPDSAWPNLLDSLNKFLGREVTRDEACEIINSGVVVNPVPDNTPLPPFPTPIGDTGSPTTNYANLNLSGLLQKDACRDKGVRYQLLVSVALPADGSASLGGEVQIVAREVKYERSKASTIKPESEGRFAPQPLLLMSTTGSFSGESIALVRWKKNQPKISSTIEVADYVGYRGLSLTRSPIGQYLDNSGTATFELIGANGAYGVCFNLTRTRQRVFGYPG